MSDDSGEQVPPHEASPMQVMEDGRSRARCRICVERVVGTPAGWFHSPDPVEHPAGDDQP